jgi:hypothetical protein
LAQGPEEKCGTRGFALGFIDGEIPLQAQI